MFASIVYTLFWAVEYITYKRACDHAERFGYADALMLWTTVALIWPAYFLSSLFLPADIALQWNANLLSPLVIGCFVLIAITKFINNLLWQYVYANEKVSVLQPYTELGSVFTIFASALFPFLHKNASWQLMAGAGAVAVVLTVASIDFKNFTFNRYCAWYTLTQAIAVVYGCLIVWLLTRFTSITIIAVNNRGLFVVSSFALLYAKTKVPLFNRNWWKLWELAFTTELVGFVAMVAFYFIISASSLVMATLLGMAQFVAILALAYFALGDKPSKATPA